MKDLTNHQKHVLHTLQRNIMMADWIHIFDKKVEYLWPEISNSNFAEIDKTLQLFGTLIKKINAFQDQYEKYREVAMNQ